MTDGEVPTAQVARVWVSPDRARWLREERTVVEELADGAVVVELPYAGTSWLVREILRGAGDLVVLEPDDAREAIAKEVAGLTRRARESEQLSGQCGVRVQSTRRIQPAPGHPEIVRIVAPNPGPMTGEGTNTYLYGSDPCAVIDPGPDIAEHIDAVRAAAEERGGIGTVLLTHSHGDHAAGAERLGGRGDPARRRRGARRASAPSPPPATPPTTSAS